VVALAEYDGGVGTNARVVECCAYTPYGEFVVTTGDGGSADLRAGRPDIRTTAYEFREIVLRARGCP
jgi:hypothetical protein